MNTIFSPVCDLLTRDTAVVCALLVLLLFGSRLVVNTEINGSGGSFVLAHIQTMNSCGRYTPPTTYDEQLLVHTHISYNLFEE